jgi:hypothetical protein
MQADPYLAPEALKNPQGWNRYAYVAGDPVNYNDPTGLSPEGGAPPMICSIQGDLAWGPFCRLWLEDLLSRAGGGAPLATVPGGRDAAGSEDLENYGPECDPRRPSNERILTFIARYRKDAAAVAEGLRVTTEAILGLSGYESGWGLERFAQEGNNFFGLHWPVSFATGYLVARGNPKVKMATFRNYRESAESFAKHYGEIVLGLTDPEDFAKALKASGKFGVGNKTYAQDLAGAIRAVVKRMDCP